MSEEYFPNRKQIDALYRLLLFLESSNIYWHKITTRGGTIVVKTEPPKGDIDVRIFKINEEGGIDDDGFRELLQEFE